MKFARLLLLPVTKRIGPWVLIDTQWKRKGDANQGVATLTNPSGGPSRLVFRGENSIATDLRMKGWDHIGAPGAWGDVIIDAYQRSGTSVASKLFRVTKLHNQQTDFEHALVDAPFASCRTTRLPPSHPMASGWYRANGSRLIGSLCFRPLPSTRTPPQRDRICDWLPPSSWPTRCGMFRE